MIDENGIEIDPDYTTKIQGAAVSAVQHMVMRRLTLTGVIRQELIAYFSHPERYTQHTLRALWTPDESTGITIETNFRWQNIFTDKKPAILIKANGMQIQKPTIAGVSEVTPQNDLSYLNMKVGSHTLFCASKSEAQVEIIAAEVEAVMAGFAPIFMKELDLTAFRPVQVGEIGRAEEAHDIFIVPIDIAWAYMSHWTIHHHARVFSKIKLSTLVNL